MSWIWKHWEPDYIKKVEKMLQDLVRVVSVCCCCCILTVGQLQEYRGRPVAAPPRLPHPSGEKWQQLDLQYGLEDMFDEEVYDAVKTQTVEEEWTAYVRAPLSPKGTDLVQYWDVSHSYVPLPCTHPVA